MDLAERWWEIVDRIHVAEGRDQWRALVNRIMDFLFSQKAGKFLTLYVTVSFSRRTLLHGIIYLFIYLFSQLISMYLRIY